LIGAAVVSLPRAIAPSGRDRECVRLFGVWEVAAAAAKRNRF